MVYLLQGGMRGVKTPYLTAHLPRNPSKERATPPYPGRKPHMPNGLFKYIIIRDSSLVLPPHAVPHRSPPPPHSEAPL